MTITISSHPTGGILTLEAGGTIAVGGSAFDGVQGASKICIKVYPAGTDPSTIPASPPADATCAILGGNPNFNLGNIPGASCAAPPAPATGNILVIWADFGGTTQERSVTSFLGVCTAVAPPGGGEFSMGSKAQAS